jgi:hypothetical protein
MPPQKLAWIRMPLPIYRLTIRNVTFEVRIAIQVLWAVDQYLSHPINTVQGLCYDMSIFRYVRTNTMYSPLDRYAGSLSCSLFGSRVFESRAGPTSETT